jgi:ABC-type phosphate/phosphonate transport system substrate-binding protein
MVISNYSDTHENVVDDILDRKADVGSVKRTILVRLAAEDPKVAKGLFIISRIPPVAESSPAVRPDLSALLKEQIRTALLNMHEDPEGIKALREFKAHQFIAMTDSDFQPRSVYIRELGATRP